MNNSENKNNEKPMKLICPFGIRIQRATEELNPGYCERHCGKWTSEKRGIHFLEQHDQQIECSRRFGLEECRGQSRAG